MSPTIHSTDTQNFHLYCLKRTFLFYLGRGRRVHTKGCAMVDSRFWAQGSLLAVLGDYMGWWYQSWRNRLQSKRPYLLHYPSDPVESISMQKQALRCSSCFVLSVWRPHSTVLWIYSWLCAYRLLLAMLRILFVDQTQTGCVQGKRLNHHTSRAVPEIKIYSKESSHF